VLPGAAGIVELASEAAVGEPPTTGAIDAPVASEPELADAEMLGDGASGTGREA
jgi:hypothetical protein